MPSGSTGGQADLLHPMSFGFGRITFPGGSPLEGGLYIAARKGSSELLLAVVRLPGARARREDNREKECRRNPGRSSLTASHSLIAAGVVLRGD